MARSFTLNMAALLHGTESWTLNRRKRVILSLGAHFLSFAGCGYSVASSSKPLLLWLWAKPTCVLKQWGNTNPFLYCSLWVVDLEMSSATDRLVLGHLLPNHLWPFVKLSQCQHCPAHCYAVRMLSWNWVWKLPSAIFQLLALHPAGTKQ